MSRKTNNKRNLVLGIAGMMALTFAAAGSMAAGGPGPVLPPDGDGPIPEIGPMKSAVKKNSEEENPYVKLQVTLSRIGENCAGIIGMRAEVHDWQDSEERKHSIVTHCTRFLTQAVFKEKFDQEAIYNCMEREQMNAPRDPFGSVEVYLKGKKYIESKLKSDTQIAAYRANVKKWDPYFNNEPTSFVKTSSRYVDYLSHIEGADPTKCTEF